VYVYIDIWHRKLFGAVHTYLHVRLYAREFCLLAKHSLIQARASVVPTHANLSHTAQFTFRCYTAENSLLSRGQSPVLCMTGLPLVCHW
jgi:hypothetical protein